MVLADLSEKFIVVESLLRRDDPYTINIVGRLHSTVAKRREETFPPKPNEFERI